MKIAKLLNYKIFYMKFAQTDLLHLIVTRMCRPCRRESQAVRGVSSIFMP